jgi:intracellular septation protein A
MTFALALQGLIPLIVFAIVDMFASLRVALISAMVIAVLEAVWSYHYFGEVDSLTWVSLGLLLVMAGASYRMKSDKLFKFQPVVLAGVMASALGYFQLKGDPLIVQMMPKVAIFLPEDKQPLFTNPIVISMMARLDALLIVTFLVHGLLIAWAAIRSTTLVWLIVRGVGFYVLCAVTLLINALLGAPTS